MRENVTYKLRLISQIQGFETSLCVKLVVIIGLCLWAILDCMVQIREVPLSLDCHQFYEIHLCR